MGIVIALVVAFVAILFLAKPASGKTGLDGIIEKYASANGIPFSILKGVIQKESNFNEKAWGDRHIGRGAIGLMQIRQPALDDFNDAHGTSYDLDELYDPDLNIRVGAWYLGGLIKRNGLYQGVEMFNVGEQGYKNGKRNTPYLVTVNRFSKDYA